METRAVPLQSIISPTGEVMTKHDILNMNVGRWVIGKKAILIIGLLKKVVTEEELKVAYPNISHEELIAWTTAYETEGLNGLRVTYRPTPPGVKLSDNGRRARIGQLIANGELKVSEAVGKFGLTSAAEVMYWVNKAKDPGQLISA